MKVILLHDVPKVGRKFDVVEVATGYASNYLFPQKLGEQATPSKIAELDKRREASKAANDARVADLKEKLATLADVTLTIVVKADDNGHLYKKIHASDILSALKDEHDIHLDKESVHLDEAIHETGDHVVSVEAAGEKIALTVQVVGE